MSSFSFLPTFFNEKKKKDELHAAICLLDRGVGAKGEDKERVEKIVQQLEEASPVKELLKHDLLNGKWELLYTTSQSILQPGVPPLLISTIYSLVQACDAFRRNPKNGSFAFTLTYQNVKLCSLSDVEGKVSEAVWGDLPGNKH